MARGKFKKPQRGGGRTFSRRIEAVHTTRPNLNHERQEALMDPSLSQSESESEHEPEPSTLNNHPADSKSDSDSESESESESKSGSAMERARGENGQNKVDAAKQSSTPVPGIEINNPNRLSSNTLFNDRRQNHRTLDMSIPIEMSRKEREAAEREAAKQRYWKLHQEGKTDQAKADMARLAIIRKQREEAAAQRLAEAKAKEDAAAARMRTSLGL